MTYPASQRQQFSKQHHSISWFQNNFSSRGQFLACLLQVPPPTLRWEFPKLQQSIISGVKTLNTHKGLKVDSIQTLKQCFAVFRSFFFFKLEYNCFTMSCQFLLYNVNQLYVYILYMYPLLLKPRSHLPSIPPSRSSQSTKLCSLCYTAAPTSCFMHGSIYTSMHSQFVSPFDVPPLCPQVCSLHPYLYSCPANRFISTNFLDSICTY